MATSIVPHNGLRFSWVSVRFPILGAHRPRLAGCHAPYLPGRSLAPSRGCASRSAGAGCQGFQSLVDIFRYCRTLLKTTKSLLSITHAIATSESPGRTRCRSVRTGMTSCGREPTTCEPAGRTLKHELVLAPRFLFSFNLDILRATQLGSAWS